MTPRKIHFLILGEPKVVCGIPALTLSCTIKRGPGVTCSNCTKWLRRHPKT